MDVEVLGDPGGGVPEQSGDVFDPQAGLVQGQVAKTWYSEWKVHAQRPSSERGQPAALAAESQVLRP